MAGEFDSIDVQPRLSTKKVLGGYLSEHENISATQAEKELNLNRSEASHILNNDPQFEFHRMDGHRKLYRLKKTDAS